MLAAALIEHGFKLARIEANPLNPNVDLCYFVNSDGLEEFVLDHLDM